MALTNCTECNHQISSSAETCPNCGVRRHAAPSVEKRHPVLNVIGAIVFVIVVFVVLVKLGSKSGNQATAPQPKPNFEVVDRMSDDNCTHLDDYCIRIHCTYRNAGNAAGRMRVRAKAFSDKRGQFADYYSDLYLEPGEQQRMTFNVPEATLEDTNIKYQCLVDTP